MVRTQDAAPREVNGLRPLNVYYTVQISAIALALHVLLGVRAHCTCIGLLSRAQAKPPPNSITPSSRYK